MQATCPKCGTADVPVRTTGYLASHNAPPNDDGFIANCGNRQPKIRKAERMSPTRLITASSLIPGHIIYAPDTDCPFVEVWAVETDGEFVRIQSNGFAEVYPARESVTVFA